MNPAPGSTSGSSLEHVARELLERIEKEIARLEELPQRTDARSLSTESLGGLVFVGALLETLIKRLWNTACLDAGVEPEGEFKRVRGRSVSYVNSGAGAFLIALRDVGFGPSRHALTRALHDDIRRGSQSVLHRLANERNRWTHGPDNFSKDKVRALIPKLEAARDLLRAGVAAPPARGR